MAGSEILLGNPENPEMIKGKMIAAHISWLRERISPASPQSAALEPFWKALPDATRERLQNGVDPSAWYPFADLVSVDRAAITVAGDGPAVLAALGRYSAEKNVPMYAIEGDAHRFLSLHAVLHSSYQNFGKAAYRPVESGGRFEITGYTAYSPIFCGSSPAFFHRVLERFGYTDVEVREVECHCRGNNRCLFEMRWKGTPSVRTEGESSGQAQSTRSA